MTSPTLARLAQITPLQDHFFPKDEEHLNIACSSTQLPSHLEWYGSQIAGHKTQIDKKGTQQLGFIKDHRRPHTILKPLQPDNRGNIERDFYASIFSPSAPASLKAYRHLIATYYGMQKLPFCGKVYDLLEISDATAGYSQPAVIDIKMGKQTFDPNATAEKRKKEIVKYPQQAIIGFRLLGFTVDDHTGRKRAKMSREECLQLQPADICNALLSYLEHRSASEAVETINSMLGQLESIRQVATAGCLHLYSSSLLVVYEADHTRAPRATVKMIDFSHVFNGHGKPDVNYLHGLATLTAHLRTIRQHFRGSQR